MNIRRYFVSMQMCSTRVHEGDHCENVPDHYQIKYDFLEEEED